jgi:hypothetical protein
MRPRPREPLSLRQPGSPDGVLLRERDVVPVTGIETRVKEKVTAATGRLHAHRSLDGVPRPAGLD